MEKIDIVSSNINKELSIIIYSCVKNSDMWPIFIKLFRKFWAGCPYEVVLLTDKLCQGYMVDGFDRIIEKDDVWAKMILNAVNEIRTPYVMLWMDDYLLCDYVNNEIMEEMLKKAQMYSVANLRLMESPIIPYKVWSVDNEFGYYEAGTAYSISTQVGIWSVEFLKKSIKQEWSAWDFERRGSIEIHEDSFPYLVSLKYTFPYEEAIRRGKWMDNGVRLCKRNGIKLDFNKRAAMNNWDLARIYFKGAVLECNPTLVVKLQNFFCRVKGK